MGSVCGDITFSQLLGYLITIKGFGKVSRYFWEEK